MLVLRRHAALSTDLVASFVGRGVRVLVTRSLQAAGVAEPPATLVDAACADFVRLYGDCLLDTSRLYEGIEGLLHDLHAAGPRLAVVTNKPIEPASRLLTALGVAGLFQVVAGGDTYPERKPDGAPLLRVARTLGVSPERCVMVGDTEIDLEAARNAGMRIAAVTWGFSSRRALEERAPDHIADSPGDLAGWLLRGSTSGSPPAA